MAVLTGYEKPLLEYSKSELVQIAQTYSVYYTTKSGQGKISGYDKLSKPELVNIIANDPDYKQRKLSKRIDQHVKTTENRIDILLKKIGNKKNPDVIMAIIQEVLSQTDFYPSPGSYYTFVYHAKTPNLVYDQYPLVAVLSIEEWGFKGINFHWQEQRNYTWNEVSSLFHVINNDEIQQMRSIQYAKFIINR